MRFAIALVLAGCTSSSDPTPTVEITAVTPESLTASDDTLDDIAITVHYEDGDGDLGGGSAVIHDCRGEALVTTLDLPAIAPPNIVDGHEPISGELDLHVDDVGDQAAAAMPSLCRDLGVHDLETGTTIFCVELVDHAGHTSAGACTNGIAIAE